MYELALRTRHRVSDSQGNENILNWVTAPQHIAPYPPLPSNRNTYTAVEDAQRRGAEGCSETAEHRRAFPAGPGLVARRHGAQSCSSRCVVSYVNRGVRRLTTATNLRPWLVQRVMVPIKTVNDPFNTAPLVKGQIR